MKMVPNEATELTMVTAVFFSNGIFNAGEGTRVHLGPNSFSSVE